MSEKQETAATISTESERAEKRADCMTDGVIFPDSPVTKSRPIRRIMQNFRLIWLGVNIDESAEYSKDPINHLYHLVNTIDSFTDVDECVDFLSKITDDNVFIIISNSLAQNIVPMIHEIAQLNSIYVYGDDSSQYQQWAEKFRKVKGIFTQINAICDSIQQATRRCDENSIPVSFISMSDIANPNLDQLDQSFMYTQLLKETLLEIDDDDAGSIEEFANYCRVQCVGNPCRLEKITEFQREYHSKTPIWWYTYEVFLYSMLNLSLRTLEVDIILKMGFFIRDLHKHIMKLYSKQSDDHQIRPTIVYRGQSLSKGDFENLKRLSGGLMSFNNFLSTSTDREVSLIFAGSDSNNPDAIGILFKITIDRSISSTPFAFIANISNHQEEEEVLFSTHTIFRIGDIKQMHDTVGQYWEVNLTLTSDNDRELKTLTDVLRKEVFKSANHYSRVGSVLVKLGRFDKAELLYELLLEQASDDSDRKFYYSQLSQVKFLRGTSDEALSFKEKSVRIPPKSFPSTLPFNFLDNIGDMGDDAGDNSKILAFSKCLKELHPIIEKTFSKIDSTLPLSYDNIAIPDVEGGDYSIQLASFESMLTMIQKFTPDNDPLLANAYNNIALVSWKMKDYSKALLYYEKELNTRKKYLPPIHPDFATIYSGVATVYVDMGDYSEALMNYEKVLEIRQRVLPPLHLHLASTYNNLGGVYFKLDDYSKALSYCERALEIRLKSLPSVHLKLASSYNNIAMVYEKMGDFSKARSFYEQAYKIQHGCLPPDDLNLPSSSNSTDMNFNWDFLENI